MAFLGLLAVGTTYAQDQDKNKKNDKSKTEQPADMKSDDVKKENPDNNQQKLSDDQKKANEDQQKQYDPNQQPEIKKTH